MPDNNSIPIRGVLFDLDGTLIDHFKVIYRCYCFALNELGLPPVTFEKVKASVGGSIPITFGKLIPESSIEDAVRLFREHYDRIWKEDIEILPGVAWLLEELKQRNVAMAILTNKEGSNARKVLKEAGLDGYFSFILGTLDTPYRKPEVPFTLHALNLLGTPLDQTCLIGDSPYDVDAAKCVDMASFTVATGSHTIEQLRQETETDGAYKDFYELGEAVFGLEAELQTMA